MPAKPENNTAPAPADPGERVSGPRKLLLAMAVGLVAATGCGLVDSDQPDSGPEASGQEAPGTADSAPAEEDQAPRLKSWEEFQQGREFSEEEIEEVMASTLEVRGVQGGCTGAIINGMLVTAAHCAEGATSLEVFRWQDSFSARVAQTDRWGADEAEDLVVAPLTADNFEQPVDTREVQDLLNQDPIPGEVFLLSSLPGDTTVPWVARVTYLGRDTDREQGKLVFVVNPEVPEDIAAEVGLPGASGTPMTNGGTGVAILRDSTGPRLDSAPLSDPPDAAWAELVDEYQTRFGVDLSEAQRFIFGSMLNQEDVDLLVANATTH